MEPPRDLFIGRVAFKRQVGGEHHRRVTLVVVVRIRHVLVGRTVFGSPLVRPGGGLGQFPLVAEQVVEVAVRPFDRRRRPRALQTARDRVAGVAGAVGADPSETLVLDRAGFRFGADVFADVGRPVGFAERVTAGDQRDGFLVVHRHPSERFADVVGGGDRVGFAVGALRVDVDQPHVRRGERSVQLTFAMKTFGPHPFGFGSPVDVFLWFPNVFASAAEAERFEAHRFERDVAGQHHQVRPRQFAAVFLFDGPQQPPSLVQVGVVGPGVERCESLCSVAGPAPAVGDPVRPGAVPSHADHERSVVPVIGGPPILGRRQRRFDVGFDLVQVQRFELRGVVEVLAHRVDAFIILGQDVQRQLIGPPIGHAVRPVAGRVFRRIFAAHDGAFGETGFAASCPVGGRRVFAAMMLALFRNALGVGHRRGGVAVVRSGVGAGFLGDRRRGGEEERGQRSAAEGNDHLRDSDRERMTPDSIPGPGRSHRWCRGFSRSAGARSVALEPAEASTPTARSRSRRLRRRLWGPVGRRGVACCRPRGPGRDCGRRRCSRTSP